PLLPTPWVMEQWKYCARYGYRLTTQFYNTTRPVAVFDSEQTDIADISVRLGDILIFHKDSAHDVVGIVTHLRPSEAVTVEMVRGGFQERRRKFTSIDKIIRIC